MKSFFDAVKNSTGTSEDILNITQLLIRDTTWIEMSPKKEIARISTFLCQSKNFEALKLLLLCSLKKPEKIPGDALLYFTSMNSNLDIQNSVFMSLHKQDPIFKNYLCPYTLKPELYEHKIKEQYNTYYKKYLKTKEELVDKLQFARSQRLEVEVKKTLEKLIEAFPNDPSFIAEKSKYFEKEAARVIDKSNKSLEKLKSTSDNYHQAQNHIQSFNAEEVYNAINSFFDDKQTEYLMEIFMLASEDDTVVFILDQNESLKNKHFWTYVELLISKRRYIEALSQIKEANKTNSTDDEFNYYYFSAICLWNLNDKSTAIDIMKSISKVKPNFKQTLFYINIWQRHSDVA